MKIIRAALLVGLRIAARFRWIRWVVAYTLQGRPPLLRAEECAALMVTRTEADLLECLRAYGYTEGLKLSAEACATLVAYAQGSTFRGNQPGVVATPAEFRKYPEVFLFRRFDPHEDCALVDAIARDSRLTKLVWEYLGAHPILHSSQIWYSLPLPPSRSAIANPEYGFHYDIDDFRFLKVFFYLSNVDDRSGPHVAIGGSHADFSWRKKIARRLSDAKAGTAGATAKVFHGLAGTGFVEDTNLYHKGTKPEEPRLVLQIEYSLTPWFRDLERRVSL